MKQLLFATSNNEKFAIAKHLCEQAGIQLGQLSEESDEIQSENPEDIIRDKAARKFTLAGNRPIIVSDDSWEIPALNGFPGPYMKSVDHWFSPEQVIDLMSHVADRRIYLHQYLAYQDDISFKIFSSKVSGQVLTQPKGTYGKTGQKVITLDSDNGLSISEIYDQDPIAAGKRHSKSESAWHYFISWYKEHGS